MTDEEIENAIPIAQLLKAHHQLDDAIESVIERDVKRGLYKLQAGPRKEQVKLLADQGMSNRQIAKVLGVHPATVDRDVSAANAALPAANAAPSNGANAPPKSKPKPQTPTPEQIAETIEQAKKEALAKAATAHAASIAELKIAYEQQLADNNIKITALEESKRKHNQELQDIENKYKDITILTDAKPEPGLNFEFSKQIDQLVKKIHDFKNNETWSSRIRELETYKNDIRLTGELEDLWRLISALSRLEKEVQTWRKQVTPTSDVWKAQPVRN